MNSLKTSTLRAWSGRLLVLLIAAALSACATTGTTSTTKSRVKAPESSSRTEIEEAVGFTIVEEGRVTADVRNRYAEALERIESGDHAGGVALLEAVTTDAPHLSAPFVDLGIEQRRAGDMAAAEASLKRAIEAAPEHPVAHNELGIVYRKIGRSAMRDATMKSRSTSIRVTTSRAATSRCCAISISVTSPVHSKTTRPTWPWFPMTPRPPYGSPMCACAWTRESNHAL